MQTDKNKEFQVKPGFVYENHAGVSRLVVSIERSFYEAPSDIAIWRTANPDLPEGGKSQGSATLASFSKWAVRARPATPEDWNAFAEVSKKRKWCKQDKKAIHRIKQTLIEK